jgi:CopG antitoxin of type II toxin-antitoxin system
VQEIWIEGNVDDMSESRHENLTSISEARMMEEIGNFWDEHSLADFWDQTHEVEFEVRAKRRRRVTLEPDVYQRIEEQARARGIAPETLVNVWLVERLETAG